MKHLTVKQAARIVRVHPETVRVWVRKGILPDRRQPGTKKILILQDDLLNPQASDLCAKA